MKRGPRDVLGVLIAVGTVACGQNGRGSGEPGSEVRDSAGIRIIENARPFDGSRLPWRIGPQPAASFPIYGYHYPQRHVPEDAMRLRDKRIAIVHPNGYSLAYDISGSPSGKWSGQYDPVATEWPLDPGQSGGPDRMAPWPGDSIIGWGDFPRDTEYGPRYVVSVFDAIGNHGRFFALSSDDPDLRVVDGTKDGLILTVSGHREEDSIAVQLWDPEGKLRSSLGTLPAVKRHDLYGNGLVWFATIFGHEPVHAPWGELIVVGNTNRYELRAYRADGSLARIVRREHELRSVTPDDVEWIYESVDSRQRERLQSVPVADHYPVFERVLADASGHLWVLEYPVPMEPTGVGAPGFPFSPTRDLAHLARMAAPVPLLWTVFDPEGRVLGFVDTPAGLEIVEIGEDYILGTTADHDPNFPGGEPNMQLLELWPLERLGGPRSGK